MQKKCSFFETKLTAFLSGVFQKDSIKIDNFGNKAVPSRFTLLIMLAMASLGYGQT